ncbi:MAG TPA: serine hydrolase, partial [Candidatus Sulfotelmatobacter sp.]|nr:serine hydrolase [Candidatus Sulfotelmatobacter sp.]
EALGSSPHQFHSLMILRHGQVIAEGWWAPYRADLPHMLYSLSKSFTSTAVGFAVAEGRLKVIDPVISFFPKDLPETVSENLAALRVKDLLTMSVGHAEDSTGSLWGEENWVKKFLSLPIQNRPGSTFLYNSGATYMLSAIVQQVTGQKVIDYLKPRLFEPLGIEKASWETCPRGINSGGWGLSVPTEALAKFGQLYLQKGSWKGKQLLPAGWVEEATTFKIQQDANASDLERRKERSDWHQGYCYQFWRSRHHSFRGDGAFGQYTLVLPEQEAVVAITSETPNMQGELELVWQHVLPAMKAAPLPANKSAQAQLREKLASLALLPPKCQAASPTAARVSDKRFQVESNAACVENVSFRFRHQSCVFTLKDNRGEYPITCGMEKWVQGETTMPGTPPKLTQGGGSTKSRIAASATWKDDTTLEMTWQYIETPHHDTVTCRFEGDKVRIEFMNSVTRLSPSRKEKRPSLQGQIVA